MALLFLFSTKMPSPRVGQNRLRGRQRAAEIAVIREKQNLLTTKDTKERKGNRDIEKSQTFTTEITEERRGKSGDLGDPRQAGAGSRGNGNARMGGQIESVLVVIGRDPEAIRQRLSRISLGSTRITF